MPSPSIVPVAELHSVSTLEHLGTRVETPIPLTMPALTITETGDHRIRLHLGGFARGEGASLQDAADDLICSLLRLVVALRAGGCAVSSEARPDFETINFLHELGDIAAAGGDIRERVFA